MNENEEHETLYTLTDGSLIPLMDKDSAETLGLFTAEHLHELHLTIVESPCAFFVSHNDEHEDKKIHNDEERENASIFPDRDGEKIFLYDIRTCRRNPLMCARCGKGERFKNKLCRRCYEKDMLIRRKSGDAYRASVKGIDRGKAIFFDLELTGVYPYDEIISVSITDGYGNEIMDTLVRPEKRKQWNTTVKIHGITPAMVHNAPYLKELVPKIKAILLNAQIIVAYGISTDYTHIKKIFTESEQRILEKKLRCCAREYVRYISEYEPDINKSALISAMEYFKIEWTGSAHTSMADTHACRFVWEKIFPACYTEAEQTTDADGKTEIIKLLENMPKTESITFDEAYELAKKQAELGENKQPSNQKKRNCKKKSAQGKSQSTAVGKYTSDNSDKKDVTASKIASNTQAAKRAQAENKVSENNKDLKKKSNFFSSLFKSKKNNNSSVQQK